MNKYKVVYYVVVAALLSQRISTDWDRLRLV